MNPRLKELINNADDGVSDALTLSPRTLKAILQELEKMCHSSDSILCEPVPGGAGFKISAKNDGRFKREFREFHIEPAGAFTVAIYNGSQRIESDEWHIFSNSCKIAGFFVVNCVAGDHVSILQRHIKPSDFGSRKLVRDERARDLRFRD